MMRVDRDTVVITHFIAQVTHCAGEHCGSADAMR